jgi:hypothetical protein
MLKNLGDIANSLGVPCSLSGGIKADPPQQALFKIPKSSCALPLNLIKKLEHRAEPVKTDKPFFNANTLPEEVISGV